MDLQKIQQHMTIMHEIATLKPRNFLPDVPELTKHLLTNFITT